jgi:hypothetical protein
MNFKWLLWLISMNVSCYYWRPLEVYTPNSNPEILFSDPAEGEPMQLRVSQMNSAFVVVQDLDMDDTLQFQWYISGAILLGPGESFSQGEFIGSKIEIADAEESWHGRTITCVVIDSANSTATTTWPIEILEEN